MPKFNGLKFIFLALLASAFFCLAMCGVTIRRTIAEIASHGNKPESRPSPFAGTSATQWRVYAGKWVGSATTREGICNQTFELRPDTKGRIAGYLTLSCIPLSGPKANLGAAAFLHMSPRSAILNGKRRWNICRNRNHITGGHCADYIRIGHHLPALHE